MARVPIIRIQPYTKGSLSAIGREVDRAEKNSRNEDIDKTRSQFNVVVKEADGGTLYRAWNAWREKHDCAEQKINKTMTAFEGAVLTASPEVFRDLGWDLEDGCRNPAVRRRCEDFLMKQYEYLCDKIGEDRILSATIHLDETTPHMQVYYVPAVDYVDQKQYAKDAEGKILRNEKGSPIYARDEQGKIITERVEGVRINRGSFWAALGGKNSYNQLQTEHYNHMVEAYPELRLERGKEGSTAEHTTKFQWEQQVMGEVLEELNGSISEKTLEITVLEETASQLQEDIEEQKQTALKELESSKAAKEEIEKKAEKMNADVGQLLTAARRLRDEVIPTYEKQKAALEQELPALQAQISEAKELLKAVEAVIAERTALAERQWGMASVKADIAKARTQQQLEAKAAAFDKLLELPQVRHIWEQLQQSQERERKKTQQQERGN